MAEQNEQKPLTLEDVQKFLQEDENGKKYLKSALDSYASKAIQTFETNFTKEKLPSLLEQEISKRYPEVTPEQKRLQELELKFAQADAERNRAQLQSKLLKKATEHKLPDFLVDYAISDNEENSYSKLLELGKKYSDNITQEVEARLSGIGRKGPIPGDNNPPTVDLNSLPNDPDYYLKNADELDRLMTK